VYWFGSVSLENLIISSVLLLFELC